MLLKALRSPFGLSAFIGSNLTFRTLAARFFLLTARFSAME